MTIRLRLTCDGTTREYAFDRRAISVGRGPLNDIVVDDARVPKRHGTLRFDDALVFECNDCGRATAIIRGDSCVATADGAGACQLDVQPGDSIRLGDDARIVLDVLSAEGSEAYQWFSQPLAAPEAVELDEEARRAVRRGWAEAAARPDVVTLLECLAAAIDAVVGRPPRHVELAIAVEREPWRSDNHRLSQPRVEIEAGRQARTTGDYRADRHGLPPFGAQARQVLAELRRDQAVVSATDDGAELWLPVRVDDELMAVAEVAVDGQGDPAALLDALARLWASFEPLASLVVRRFEAVRQADALVEENRYFRQRQRRHYLFKNLIAESPAMREVYDQLNAWVSLDAPALIIGEAGCGKALLARALHHLGPRSERLLLSVNCSSLPGELLDFELFGCVDSELTGKVEPRKGILELGDGGTVLLEEVDQLSPILQGKLLRVLREGELRRIGESVARHVDCRIIASSHRDLSELVAQGQLRRDLYMALNAYVLRVPPLRDRREDILPLARTFLKKFAGRYGRACCGFAHGVHDRLLDHPWRGNVRELQSRIESAVLQSDDDVTEISAEALALG